MNIIERLERAQEQTWWLPSSVEVHETAEYCLYQNGDTFYVVRFTPTPDRIHACLEEIVAIIGEVPALFSLFPHRHDSVVVAALCRRGFVLKQRHQARVIEVAKYKRPSSSSIQVLMVQTFDQMKQLYQLRAQSFGQVFDVSDETLRLYVKDATATKARVRQFLALDAESGQAVSQAGMSIYPDLKVAFFFAGGTITEARQKGAYTALVAARVAYARSVGIDYVGLFAREDTSAPIVAKQGFEQCGEMHYWSLNGG